MRPTLKEQWHALRQRHPVGSVILVALILGLILANSWAAARWIRYSSESERLRATMSDVEKARVNVELAHESKRLRVMMELLRRQARGDRDLHLAVVVDSGLMRLQRSGAVLRSMSVQVGPERALGTGPAAVRMVAPRGERTVARVVTERDVWAVPGWVYRDRGMTPPNDTVVAGGLGPLGIVLSDGTLIYAIPEHGPLADSAYVLPGSIRAEGVDLRALAPNVNAGMKVYFYD